MHLRGLTNYGDSVEDEWLIVYILKELSKQFPDLWIKTVDTDGEFLLIEAANALPRWLNPEIADNRVGTVILAHDILMHKLIYHRFGFIILLFALFLLALILLPQNKLLQSRGPFV